MKDRRILSQILLSIALALSLILLTSVAGASAAVPMLDDHSTTHSTIGSSALTLTMALNTPQGNVTPMVAAGWLETVGLRSGGTVVAVGWNFWGQCNVANWTDTIQVAAGGGDMGDHTVGLRSDGTVVAVGSNSEGQCEVDDWRDIVQVAAGDGHTVGLKSNGTVVAVGYNNDGQCDVADWTDIVQIAANSEYTVGLRSGGTVVSAGSTWQGQLDASKWTDIVQVAANHYHIVGLKSDGTVVIAGPTGIGQPVDTSKWTDIVQIAAYLQVVGLKAGGTVVATGDNRLGQCEVDGWKDIVQVAAGAWHTVGLKADGTVVGVGYEGAEQWPIGYPPDMGVNWTDAVDQITASITIELTKWHLGNVMYVLTISSARGGSVTAPGEGVFTYNGGAMVDLIAEPEEGYRFVRWNGDVRAIGNSTAAATTISMRGDYSIMASFKRLVNWALIGGVIAAVVAGLAIFFVRRRRATKTRV